MIKYLLLLIILIIVICLIAKRSDVIGCAEVYGGSVDIFERMTPLTEYKKSSDSSNILGTFVKSSRSKSSTSKPQKNKKTLAQKLTDAGWKLYVKESCPWCHLQVDMFGEDKQYLHIIDCSKLEYPESKNPANVDLRECNSVWVYPTWVNGNKILPGSQSFSSLTDALNGKFYTSNTSKSPTKK